MRPKFRPFSWVGFEIAISSAGSSYPIGNMTFSGLAAAPGQGVEPVSFTSAQLGLSRSFVAGPAANLRGLFGPLVVGAFFRDAKALSAHTPAPLNASSPSLTTLGVELGASIEEGPLETRLSATVGETWVTTAVDGFTTVPTLGASTPTVAFQVSEVLFPFEVGNRVGHLDTNVAIGAGFQVIPVPAFFVSLTGGAGFHSRSRLDAPVRANDD